MSKFPLKRHHVNRGRIIAVTLAALAIGWILADQFVLRQARCVSQMCPINDYGYLLRILLVVALSAIAVWLLKNPPKEDSNETA